MSPSRRAIPRDIDRRVREVTKQCCGYSLSLQWFVMARLKIEIVVPLAKGGTDDESILWLACPLCGGHKSDKTEAVDPETGAQ
jgi:5-methylcytosine-specific restriction endonuclease McrA